MARLASNAKMGYYPTLNKTLLSLRSWLKFRADMHILDPCCGTGEALQVLCEGSSAITYGVELDFERADQSSDTLRNAIAGSIFDARINPLGSMGMLYLNPPYDMENGERVEMQFLKHATKWLCSNGVLVFVVPAHIFSVEKYRTWITDHYRDITVVLAHKDDYPEFNQAILFAEKSSSGSSDFPQGPYEHIEDAVPSVYTAKYTTGPTIFQGTDAVTEDDVRDNRKCVITQIEGLSSKQIGCNTLRPILPLRKGHLVSLITAGIIDGRIESADGPMILKGFHERKESKQIEQNVEIVRDTFNVGIRVLEPEKGVWYDIA